MKSFWVKNYSKLNETLPGSWFGMMGRPVRCHSSVDHLSRHWIPCHTQWSLEEWNSFAKKLCTFTTFALLQNYLNTYNTVVSTSIQPSPSCNIFIMGICVKQWIGKILVVIHYVVQKLLRFGPSHLSISIKCRCCTPVQMVNTGFYPWQERFTVLFFCNFHQIFANF